METFSCFIEIPAYNFMPSRGRMNYQKYHLSLRKGAQVLITMMKNEKDKIQLLYSFVISFIDLMNETVHLL